MEINIHQNIRGLDVGVLRPYLDPEVNPNVVFANVGLNTGKPQVFTSPIMPGINASSLTYDDWVDLDEMVDGVGYTNRVFYNDMRAAGLIEGVPFSATVAKWQNRTLSGQAQVSMSPVTVDSNDRQGYDYEEAPIPIFSAGFNVNLRETDGRPYVERDSLEDATAAVTKLVERTIIGINAPFTVANASLFGFYTKVGRLTLAVGDWLVLTPEQVVLRINQFIQHAVDAGLPGPYVLYIPNNYATIFGLDYKAESDRTLLERVLADGRISEVKVSDDLRNYEPLLISWASRLTRIKEGQAIIPVQWQSMGPLATQYKVMQAMTLQLRRRVNERTGNLVTGYVHGTTV